MDRAVNGNYLILN